LPRKISRGGNAAHAAITVARRIRAHAPRALRRADAEVVLIDRRNHDIFQLTLRKARLSAAGRRNLVVDFYVTGERSTDARY